MKEENNTNDNGMVPDAEPKLTNEHSYESLRDDMLDVIEQGIIAMDKARDPEAIIDYCWEKCYAHRVLVKCKNRPKLYCCDPEHVISEMEYMLARYANDIAFLAAVEALCEMKHYMEAD